MENFLLQNIHPFQQAEPLLEQETAMHLSRPVIHPSEDPTGVDVARTCCSQSGAFSSGKQFRIQRGAQCLSPELFIASAQNELMIHFMPAA